MVINLLVKPTMKNLRPLLTWLKEAGQNLISLLEGLLLVPLALILLAFAIPAGAIHYGCTIGSRKQNAREIMTNTGTFSFLIAYSIDCLGNVVTPGLWNWLFLSKPGSFLFGIPGQSLSLVLGLNFYDDNLGAWGIRLFKLLNWIDPEHCVKAVDSYVAEAKHLLEVHELLMIKHETKIRTAEFLAKY